MWRIQWYLLVMLMIGCKTVTPSAPVVGLRPPGPPNLPSAQRNSLEPDYAKLPGLPNPALEPSEVHYRAVTEREVQCLSVLHSETGNALDQENLVSQAQPDPVPSYRLFRHRRKRDCPTNSAKAYSQEVRYWAGIEARSRSSGTALELYYRLAEAEASADLGQESRLLLDEAIRQAEEAQIKGLRVQIGPEQLRLTRSELDVQLGELHINIRKLNIELKHRIGVEDSSSDERLWPVKDWPLEIQPLSIDASMQLAMEQRAELNGLRVALNGLNEETLPAARSILNSFNGLLGLAPLGLRADIFGTTAPATAEIAQRLVQMDAQLRDRERQVRQEVRQAVEEIPERVALLGTAKERYEVQEQRLKEIREKAAKGLANPLEVINVQLELNRARQAAIKEVFAFQRARVRVKLAVGALVPECYQESHP